MISLFGCSSPFFESFLGAITIRSPASCLESEWRDSEANKNANDETTSKERIHSVFSLVSVAEKNTTSE